MTKHDHITHGACEYSMGIPPLFSPNHLSYENKMRIQLGNDFDTLLCVDDIHRILTLN